MVNVPILPLRLENVQVTRQGKCLIGPITHEVTERGLTIVMGPNGAGKTCLLKLMHGLERPAQGRLDWAGSRAEVRARQAFVFQTPVMMRRTVLENVTYPLRIHGVAAGPARAQATEWLARVGLAAAADRQATVLSGGERQKLALARALIRSPDILFLDEPCANLDGRAMREIEDVLLKQANEFGTRIIMATHDIGQARRLADDVMFIYRGLLHETAPAAQFFDRPETPEARAFINGDIVE